MSESKQRIFVFDNVKALLIVLVVLGHAADYYTDDFKSMRIFFFYIYLFHMPLFIFLAGLFSKSTILKDPFRIEKIANFLVLYFILEILFYFIIHFWLGNEHYTFNPFVENGVPWFMFAMAAWLCIGRVLRNVPAYIVLPVSIICALLIGYTQAGDVLVLSRIITFFPFFLLGFYVQPKDLMTSLQSPELKIISAISLVLIAFTIYFNIDGLYEMRNLLSGRNGYDKVHLELGIIASGAVMRLLTMIVTVCMSIAVMALMTQKQTWFTILGTRSLAIYFFHRPILFIYQHYHVNHYLKEAFPKLWLWIYLAFFLLVAIVLAATPFEKALRTIQQFVERIIKNKKAGSR
jgi:fucose 4-O-acetylase-like acetyltransferase